MRCLLLMLLLTTVACRKDAERPPVTNADGPASSVPTTRHASAAPGTQPAAELTNSIEERVFAVVSAQMNVPRSGLARATTLAELKVDQLDLVELVMELEDRFEITIPDEEVDQFKTIGQMIDFVKRTVEP